VAHAGAPDPAVEVCMKDETRIEVLLADRLRHQSIFASSTKQVEYYSAQRTKAEIDLFRTEMELIERGFDIDSLRSSEE
jgi:hypothetical protein